MGTFGEEGIFVDVYILKVIKNWGPLSGPDVEDFALQYSWFLMLHSHFFRTLQSFLCDNFTSFLVKPERKLEQYINFMHILDKSV